MLVFVAVSLFVLVSVLVSDCVFEGWWGGSWWLGCVLVAGGVDVFVKNDYYTLAAVTPGGSALSRGSLP